MPMTRYKIIITLIVFLSFANLTNSEDFIGEVWEVYADHDTYVIAIHKQAGKAERITFKFEYFSEDGLRLLAIIRGHSVGTLIPLSIGESCFYVKLYENFEFTENDYIICETKEKIILSNIDVRLPTIMPVHLIFSKKMHSSQ